MTEHESDLWPERRWGVFCPPHKNGVIEAKPFKTEAERNAWVAENPLMRQAVGVRHQAVKALRGRWRAEAIKRLRAWKEKHG